MLELNVQLGVTLFNRPLNLYPFWPPFITILNKKKTTTIQVTYIYIIQNRKKDLSKFGVHFNSIIHKTIYGVCSIIFKKINLRCSDEKKSNLFRSNNVNLCTFCYYNNLFQGEYFQPYEISQENFSTILPNSDFNILLYFSVVGILGIRRNRGDN